MNHMQELGYHENPSSGCDIWRNKTFEVNEELLRFLQELEEYDRLVQNFPAIPDVRPRRHEEGVCEALQIHKHGLLGHFKSGQLSQVRGQMLEPVLPPARHPRWCLPPNPKNRNNRAYLLHLGYLVHDFAAICQTLKPTSRTVLVDMGASLEFGFHKDVTPAIYLTDTYKRFGIPFDHIYAYEINQIAPKEVFKKVPDELMSAYHWINVGVETDINSKLNPWNLIKDNFSEEDLVIVKLDIDNNRIEAEFIRQLLVDETLSKLVDQFYYEHHVSLKEWFKYDATLKESIEMFSALRGKGIPAHYWV